MSLSEDAEVAPLLGGFQAKAYARNQPLYCLIELTRRCNENCSHCYAAVSGGREEMPTPRIKRLLEEVKEEGGLIATFTGGEATLHRDFLDLLDHATRLRFAIQVFTNGTRIDEPMADEISRRNIFQVGISVYGATPGMHDAITRLPGSHAAALRAATLLRDRGVPVVFKYVMMSVNMPEYEAMLHQSEALDVRFRIDGIITSRDNGDASTFSLRIGEADLGRVLKDKAERENAPKGLPEAPKDLTCTLAKSTCAVTAYGDVYGCVAMPVAAGNVMERPFREIWRGSPVLEKMRRVTTDDLPVCRSCELRNHCTRCAGMAYVEHGDFYGPSSEACRQASITKALREGADPSDPHFEEVTARNLERSGMARAGLLRPGTGRWNGACGDRNHAPASAKLAGFVV
ncbi:MAG: radical SAM protein [Planctomycetes bacterium]|nr:radical SAM protein [Planctomycetota bacterium]